MSIRRTKKLKTLSKRALLAMKPFLDEMNDSIEVPSYISADPVQFMHAYEDVVDKEIAGFFAAIMAWGRRDIVIAKVSELMERMHHRPAEFVRTFSEQSMDALKGFKHRTFKEEDVYWLMTILKHILLQYGRFEGFWAACYADAQARGLNLMEVFHDRFFEVCPQTPQRTRKHIASAAKKSSCKRLWLYLRWAVRKPSVVDCGIMSFMPPSELMIPLDVHVARQARRLGLLSRQQNDFEAVKELTERLKQIHPNDPSRYDYALFGIGVLKETIPQEWLVNAWWDEE